MRIFLDANILFSAARSDGPIRQLVGLLVDERHECWVDGFVLEEARRNLQLKSPTALPALEGLLGHVHVGTVRVDPDAGAELPLHEKDRPVLASAIAHRCQVLVTGDRTHFGRLFGCTIEGVTIHSPRTLAESLLR